MKKHLILILLLICISLVNSGCKSSTSATSNKLQIDDYLSDFTGNVILYSSSDIVDVNISFTNASDKMIKSIEFEITPYNSDNEPVRRSATVKFDKTIAPDEVVNDWKQTNVWCSDNIDYAIISNIDFEFIDGEKNTNVQTNIHLTSQRLNGAPERPRMEEVAYLSDYIVELSGTISSPNSVGSVDVTLGFKNFSDKTIKYVTFDVVPYNAVDDPVDCNITDKSRTKLRGTGPILSNAEIHTFKWENVWYNYTIDYFMIKEIGIEFIDGEKLSFDVNKMIL